MSEQDLLSQIEQVEEEIRDKQKTLLDLQHEYLSSNGWEILPLSDDPLFGRHDFSYTKGDLFYLEIDYAMEDEEEINGQNIQRTNTRK